MSDPTAHFDKDDKTKIVVNVPKSKQPDQAEAPIWLASLRLFIFVQIWQISNGNHIRLKRKMIRYGKTTFSHKGHEYIISFNQNFFEPKAWFFYQLILNYKLEHATPIGFIEPNLIIDARLSQEVHRRKAFTSLLNHADFMLMVMVLVAIVAAGAMAILNLYSQSTNEETIARLTSENHSKDLQIAQLKQALGQEIPPAQ